MITRPEIRHPCASFLHDAHPLVAEDAPLRNGGNICRNNRVPRHRRDLVPVRTGTEPQSSDGADKRTAGTVAASCGCSPRSITSLVAQAQCGLL